MSKLPRKYLATTTKQLMDMDTHGPTINLEHMGRSDILRNCGRIREGEKSGHGQQFSPSASPSISIYEIIW